MNRFFITGLIVMFLRLAAGTIDGSAALGLFGLWGLYTCIFLNGWLRLPLGEVRKERKQLFLLFFLLLLATFLFGLITECVKEFFQIYVGIYSDPPGILSIAVLILTTLVWEGGLLALFARKRGGKINTWLHTFLGVFTFFLIGSGYFLKGVFLMMEPAGSFILCLLVFLRILLDILRRASLFMESESALSREA